MLLKKSSPYAIKIINEISILHNKKLNFNLLRLKPVEPSLVTDYTLLIMSRVLSLLPIEDKKFFCNPHFCFFTPLFFILVRVDLNLSWLCSWIWVLTCEPPLHILCSKMFAQCIQYDTIFLVFVSPFETIHKYWRLKHESAWVLTCVPC